MDRQTVRCSHTKYGSRRWVRPKIRHLAPLDGCACTFEKWVYRGWKVTLSNELTQIIVTLCQERAKTSSTVHKSVVTSMMLRIFCRSWSCYLIKQNPWCCCQLGNAKYKPCFLFSNAFGYPLWVNVSGLYVWHWFGYVYTWSLPGPKAHWMNLWYKVDSTVHFSNVSKQPSQLKKNFTSLKKEQKNDYQAGCFGRFGIFYIGFCISDNVFHFRHQYWI